MVRTIAVLTVGFLLSVAGCKKGGVQPAGGAPTCPEGQVLRGDRCGPAAGDDCDIIEDRGGCAPGFECEPGQGCVPDGSLEECAEDGTCPDDDVCQQGFCVDPNADNDHDGVRAGDDCNDFEADVGQCAEGEECVEGRCGEPGEDGDGDGEAFPDDCDDRDADINNGADEACNGIDDNCDGVADEGCVDGDGDGFNGCDEVRDAHVCDCDDANDGVNPGMVDVCGPDGAGLGGADCDPNTDGCGPGASCCGGDACVDVRFNEDNCGTCGTVCELGEFCANGACLTEAGGIERAPGDEEAIDPSPFDQQYPAIAFNRQTIWSFYGGPWSFWWHFFEYGYGIAWVEDVGNHGVINFTARQFNVCPLAFPGFFPGAAFQPPCIDDIGCLNPVCGFGFFGNFYPTTQIASLQAESAVVALAPGGAFGYGLAWSDTPAGNGQIFFGNTESYGFFGGGSFPVTQGFSNAERPALAWSPFFFVLGAGFGLVYEDDASGVKQIMFQRVDSFWSHWLPFGVAVQVSNDALSATAASIAWSPAGFGVVYVGADEGDLYFARMSELGFALGNPVRVTNGAQVAGTRTGITWNDDLGEFGVVYEGSPEGAGENEEIYFVRMTSEGALLGNPLRVTNLETNQNAPTVVWSGEDYGVVWYDSRFADDEHPEVVFARISRDGDEVIEELQVTDHRGNGFGTHPAIAYGWNEDFPIGFLGDELIGRGEYALVWNDKSGDAQPSQIMFTRYVRQ